MVSWHEDAMRCEQVLVVKIITQAHPLLIYGSSLQFLA